MLFIQMAVTAWCACVAVTAVLLMLWAVHEVVLGDGMRSRDAVKIGLATTLALVTAVAVAVVANHFDMLVPFN